MDFNHSLQKGTVRINHRATEPLRQKPSRPVDDAKLRSELLSVMPLECVVARCSAQNHICSGHFERCRAVLKVIEV